MLGEYLRFAVDGIRGRSLRSWLTTMGVIIGVMAVVTFVSLGFGLQDFVNAQFNTVGLDRISVTPGGGGFMFGPPSSSSFQAATLTDEDLEVIRKVPGVESAYGGNIFSGNVQFDGKTRAIGLFAAPTDPKSVDVISEIDYYMVDQGRYLRDEDKYKAQVGPTTGKDYFDSEVGIGDKIIIEGYEFEIVGVNKKTGTPFQDSKITIPLKTGQEIFDRPGEFSIISVKVAPSYVPADVADDIKKKLRKSRGVKEGEEDFSAETSENIIAVFNTVITIIVGFVIAITFASLIVGALGIMTTMYTSVLERTKQIGIMKSVGAKNTDILSIFVIEAGLLGLAGGVIGTAAGLTISKIVEAAIRALFLDKFNSYMSFEIVALALLAAFAVGCLSGLLPAWRASKMNPVDALRYG